MIDQKTAGAAQTAAKAGKYLTFGLGQEQYGLEILKVREVVGMMSITRVPRTPAFIKGIVNLRGKVIPVMDLRVRFQMPSADYGSESCIVVAFLRDVEMGILVDKVIDVLDIPDADIEETPSFGPQVDTAFLAGVGKSGGRIVLMLDLNRVLTGEETAALVGAASNEQSETTIRS